MNSSSKTGAPTLRLRGITRTYPTASGGLMVLKGVDLDIMPGEVVGLIGPSGSGKSSLLHAAGLLERPTSGQVMIDGEDVGGLDERARTRLRLSRIGFVYQFHHLLPEFDARDNVALPMRIAGHSEAEARRRAEALLTSLGLGERFTHQPAQLSGGEQQRVAIARAVIARPQLLVADEPTGNVDPEMAMRLLGLFEALNRLGTTVIVATHDIHLISRIDNAQMMRLEKGRLADPTGALRYPPANRV